MAKYKARFIDNFGLDMYYEFNAEPNEAKQKAEKFVSEYVQCDYKLDSIRKQRDSKKNKGVKS